MSSFWTCIPLSITSSAHSRSVSWSSSTARSTSRNSQVLGQSAATVSKPRGGWIAFLGRISMIFAKLQKDAGKRGQIIKVLIAGPNGGKLGGGPSVLAGLAVLLTPVI